MIGVLIYQLKHRDSFSFFFNWIYHEIPLFSVFSPAVHDERGQHRDEHTDCKERGVKVIVEKSDSHSLQNPRDAEGYEQIECDFLTCVSFRAGFHAGSHDYIFL